ncbi:hypothetical protein [Terrilactibacillus laevilacticus]|uniref:hypothetical protein n=1 Tax=Terrilactibacillus laevilacticus TaxID=1380157 RepID=UPI0011478562|nr:hypothetical protein [Terrilactibacillus laevilacticus]
MENKNTSYHFLGATPEGIYFLGKNSKSKWKPFRVNAQRLDTLNMDEKNGKIYALNYADDSDKLFHKSYPLYQFDLRKNNVKGYSPKVKSVYVGDILYWKKNRLIVLDTTVRGSKNGEMRILITDTSLSKIYDEKKSIFPGHLTLKNNNLYFTCGEYQTGIYKWDLNTSKVTEVKNKQKDIGITYFDLQSSNRILSAVFNQKTKQASIAYSNKRELVPISQGINQIIEKVVESPDKQKIIGALEDKETLLVTNLKTKKDTLVKLPVKIENNTLQYCKQLKSWIAFDIYGHLLLFDSQFHVREKNNVSVLNPNNK